MAATAAAALLDELMGRDRNVAPGERKREIRWDDPEVCKHFLSGFCPTELFTNTRADLGICEKLHDEALKKAYVKSTRFGRVGYEDEFVRHLQSLLSDVERRIKRGHARLALNNTQGMLNQPPVNNASQEQIEILTSRINELVEEAEELGCEGKVEEAQGVMKLCEQLREEREQLTANRRGGMDEENIKRMEVCQVCGALLVSGDAQQRIDEHMSGKQHVGYARIREFVESYKKDGGKVTFSSEQQKGGKTSPVPEDPEAQIQAEKEEREKIREKEREDRKKTEEKDRERSRDKDRRKRRSRSRSKHRSRSRDRSRRSRSRERKKSRDRDRERRSRHKSRSRSRSRRSSRERPRRSRSRDRKSRKHRDDDESRKSSEKNGGGEQSEHTEKDGMRNPPEPPSEPMVDEPDYTAGDTN